MPPRVALTAAQRAVLAVIARSPLGSSLYWTGGTLLATHYLHHRRSHDLDFFTEDLPDDLAVAAAMRDVRDGASATDMRHVRFPNRWQYFLRRQREELKLEIVYFPFPSLGRRLLHPQYRIRLDTLRDLAANKTHAAFERREPRDAFDLYAILRRTRWTLARVLRDVERKFGVALDPVHLVAKLRAGAERLEDLRPLTVGKLPDPRTIAVFFQTHADRYLRQTLR